MDFKDLIATQSEIFYMNDVYSAGRMEVSDLDDWFYGIDTNGDGLYLIKHEYDVRYITRLKRDAVWMYDFLTKSH